MPRGSRRRPRTTRRRRLLRRQPRHRRRPSHPRHGVEPDRTALALAGAAARIAGLLAVGAAPASAQDDLPDAAEARERAGEILAGDEFSGSGEGDGGEIGDGTGAAGAVALPEAADSGGGGFEFPGLGSPGLSWLLYGAIVAAIVALAIWFGRRAVDQEVTEAIKRKRAASPGPLRPR